jgi:hypothetical protein
MGYADNDEYMDLLSISDELKQEADEDMNDIPGGERPATVRQLLTAGELTVGEAVDMTKLELRELCAEYTRNEISVVIDQLKGKK